MTPQVIDPNRRYRLVPDACALLGISRSLAFKKIRAGTLKAFKDPDARIVYVHGSEIIRLSRPPESD